jgi:hypothetical protein
MMQAGVVPDFAVAAGLTYGHRAASKSAIVGTVSALAHSARAPSNAIGRHAFGVESVREGPFRSMTTVR